MTEHSEFYKKMMEAYDRQIREIEQPTKYSSAESTNDDDFESNDDSRPEKEKHEKPKRKKNNKPISKAQKLRELKEKYPYHSSEYKRYEDRDPLQYHKLVSTKNLIIAEFVLKWEHLKKKRIHKNMAWKILTELQNTDEITDEFLNSLLEEFDE